MVGNEIKIMVNWVSKTYTVNQKFLNYSVCFAESEFFSCRDECRTRSCHLPFNNGNNV